MTYAAAGAASATVDAEIDRFHARQTRVIYRDCGAVRPIHIVRSRLSLSLNLLGGGGTTLRERAGPPGDLGHGSVAGWRPPSR